MKTKILIPFVLFVVILLVVNMILLALKKISQIFFWIILGFTAIFAYKILPKMRKG